MVLSTTYTRERDDAMAWWARLLASGVVTSPPSAPVARGGARPEREVASGVLVSGGLVEVGESLPELSGPTGHGAVLLATSRLTTDMVTSTGCSPNSRGFKVKSEGLRLVAGSSCRRRHRRRPGGGDRRSRWTMASARRMARSGPSSAPRGRSWWRAAEGGKLRVEWWCPCCEFSTDP